MAVQISDTGIVQTDAKDFPILAVNVLDRLGYQVNRASKQLDQILATERLDEQIGQDWWRHEYRVVLRWREANSGGMFVSVDLVAAGGRMERNSVWKKRWPQRTPGNHCVGTGAQARRYSGH